MDFSPKLREIFTECRYMEQLGFEVPLLACSKALQVSVVMSTMTTTTTPMMMMMLMMMMMMMMMMMIR